MSHKSGDNVILWVDVRLRVDGGTVSASRAGHAGGPLRHRAGETTVTGLFDGDDSADEGPQLRTALVTSAGSPMEVPAGTLTGCDVSVVVVGTS